MSRIISLASARGPEQVEVQRVAAEVPLRVEADAVVDPPDREPVVGVARAVVARGEAQQVAPLEGLEPGNRRGIGKVGPERFEPGEVLVELLDDLVGVSLEGPAQPGEHGGVLLAESGELLAPLELGLGHRALGGGVVRGCHRFVEGPRSRIGRVPDTEG
jgi:hypothetical protein